MYLHRPELTSILSAFREQFGTDFRSEIERELLKAPRNRANAVSMRWLAPNYPVHWAFQPDEVTQWDTSRGFPLSDGIDGRSDEQLKNTPSGILRADMARDDFDPTLGMSRYEYNLYSDGFTRPTRYAPAGDYPRLVRSHYNRTECGEFQHERDVLRELSAIACKKYLGQWRAGKGAKKFLDKLAQTSSWYGSPYSPLENTLFAWLALVTHVDIYKRALFDLQTTPGGLLLMLEGLERRFNEVAHRIKRKNESITPKRAEMTLLHPLFDAFTGSAALSASKGYASPLMRKAAPLVKHVLFFCGKAKFHQTINLDFLELLQIAFLAEVAASKVDEAQGAHTPPKLAPSGKDDLNGSKELADAVRLKVADMLMSVFRNSVANPPYGVEQRLIPDLAGLTVSCPVGVWVEMKLAEMWAGNFALQACAECGTIFRPTHGSTLYCRVNNCADTVYYRNKKARRRE